MSCNMLFRFDANQEHQLQAMAAVVDQFEGQPRVEKDLQFELGASFASVPNRLELDEAALLANLRKVQARNGLNPDEGLELVEEPITTAAGPKQARFGSFSVEMETGTGKTYVYLRTALELNRQYGMCKFVIVAPIRERIRDNRRLAGYDKGNNRAAKCFLPAVARMARAPSPRSLSPPAPLAADSL